MHSRLMEWSRWAYLAGIVLALVLIIPTAWFPFQLTKIAVFALLALVSVVLFAAGGGSRELMRSHGIKLALLTALLPLTYFISWFLSTDRALGFIGSSIEADTLVFVTLGFIAFILSFTLFRTLRTVKLLLRVVFITLIAAAVFQTLVILFGTSLIPLHAFSDKSVNLIGKWNDLGILLGLLTLFLLVRSELGHLSFRNHTIAGVGLLALAFMLGIINFSLVWGFLLVGCIAIAILHFLAQKMEEPTSEQVDPYVPSRSMMRKIPWFSLLGSIVAILFLFFGTSLNSTLTSIFPVSSLEVRPSYSSTMEILDGARSGMPERMLLGTGPNTFGQSWLVHKPAAVNLSAFWNLDFNVGFSTFVTALGTVGLIGIIAWLIPILLVLAGLVRAMRLATLSREERLAAATVGLGSLFLFAAVVLYVPSQNIILLGLTLCGATFGFLWRQGRAGQSTEEEAPTRMHVMSGLAAMIVLIALTLGVSFVSTRHLIAQAHVGLGSVALQAGNTDAAIASAATSNKVEQNSDALRLSITANLTKLQQIASSNSQASADVQKQFTALAQQSINTGQELVSFDQGDYRSYLLLGRVYDLLASLKIQGAYESAKSSYDAAIVHNPTDPEIPLLLARLEAVQGHIQPVQKYLSQSLTLKQNYTDAILFLVQLNVANNDIPNAIQAAKAATQSAPGVASIWFELGLLYYSAGDTASAIAPLEQSISLVPDYANAKYFLGLSYYAQKRSQDSIKQFQDLARSNPDSNEVKLILGNLQLGKPPFESAQPPITSTPQKRPTAPLSQ